MHRLLQFIYLLGLVLLVGAHPGENEVPGSEAHLLQKRAYHSNVINSHARCAQKLQLSGVNQRADLRRRNTVEQHRQILATRQEQQILGPSTLERLTSPNFAANLPDQLRKSHLATDPSIGPKTPESELFANNGTCVLNPGSVVGPFYVKGELVRSDITDGQAGVPVTIDAQFIDVETCEPLEGVWWDIWSCNATGVYSGVEDRGNGDVDDSSNLNTTFLRGIQRTDSEGVAQFQTIFPGHYTHRATHIHVVAHVGNVTQLPNNTIIGGTVPYIGQLYWDQDLIDEVEKAYPYNTNDLPRTPNARDWLFREEIEGTSSDPILNYVRLGEKIEDGIFAWISVAVNVSASLDPGYRWRFTDHGDVPESGGDNTN